MLSFLSRPTYDNDVAALIDSIKIVADQHGLAFRHLALKYKQEFVSSSGQLEFEEFLRKIIPIVDKMLSKQYKKRFLSKYYSEYGLVATIHSSLKSEYMSQYEDMRASF